MYAQLYNPKTIEKKYSKISITTKQRKAANEWIKKLKNKELEKEKKNYFVFRDVILRDLLGYPEKKILYEEKNVEFSIQDEHGDTGVCYEAKGTETKDLFARQGYEKKEQENPVVQTLSDMKRFPASYGVCTNYRNFVLLDIKKRLSKCHRFDFLSIENDDKKLKEFLGIFSYENLVIKKSLDDLYKSSVSEEREFTKEFYKLFHETRLMLIKAFQEKEKVTMDEAIHYAQLFLNRLIFIFFAEDKGDIEDRLFSKRVLKILEAGQGTESTRSVSDDILKLFKYLDKGSDVQGIFGFNGGFFKEKIPPKIYFFDLKNTEFFQEVKQHSKLSKKIKLDELSSKIVKKYKDGLNPIISNLLIMDSFDFNTEVNVNILGHIFEQSISDLEDLRKERTTKRKEEGVFYTPEYVTEYICTSTIIPYLSKNNASTTTELIGEYLENPEELESRIRKIKILDPACGSGAFLVKAVEILLEIDREIQSIKPQTNGQAHIEDWSDEKEITKIIEKNVFGVDLNEESVEITKLSLLLKMSTPNKKLSDLSKNIRTGNSIINDKKIDPFAFNWKNTFPKIFEEGGFNIVIGNPPYIPIELMSKQEKQHYAKNYDGIYRKYDTSVIFAEKLLKIMNKEGYLGFIMPLTWQTGDNYPNFRKLLFEKMKVRLTNLVNLPFDVFPDAYVDTGIAIFKKHSEIKKFFAYQYPKNEKISSLDISGGEYIDHNKILANPECKVFPSVKTYEYSKASDEYEHLGTITNSTQGIVTSKYPISPSKKSDKWVPFLLKADGNRYRFQIRETAFIDSTSIPNILHLYTKPKIMIRRIVNRQNRLMAFYEGSGIVTNKDYNPFVLTSDDFDIFYILGLLNSRFFSYQYVEKSSLALKDDFRQTTLAEIRKLNIKPISPEEQDEIVERVKKMNDLTMEYFESKDKFLRRVAENFSIKVNKKLTELLDLEFLTFRKTIESLAKRKLTLNEQDQWEKYFTDNTNKLKKLRDKLVSLDSQIDGLVYDLYGVSQDEIKLIESKILETRY